MNRFEGVCDNCPLRTKVDIDRASESGSWGSDGLHSQLSDGKNRYDVTLANGEVCDSDTVRAIEQDVESKIDKCDGPREGLLRQKCGVGLARAWRWSELVGTYTPNISSPDEITPLLEKADYRDAMPHFEEATWLVGDPRDFSELDCSDRSAFTNYGIKKLASTVRGTGAELEKGMAVMLDRVSWSADDESLQDVFRIRVAQGGPRFAFHSSIELDYNDPKEKYTEAIEKIFAEGIHAYLFSDEDAVKQSKTLITHAESLAYQRFEKIDDWLASGGLSKALRQADDRKKEMN